MGYTLVERNWRRLCIDVYVSWRLGYALHHGEDRRFQVYYGDSVNFGTGKEASVYTREKGGFLPIKHFANPCTIYPINSLPCAPEGAFHSTMEVELDYKKYHNTSLHVAILTKRGKVLATSRNRVGSRSRGCGWSDATLHAERAVVKSLGDTSRLQGCTLTVYRVLPTGEYSNSKPCHSCQVFLEKCMREYGMLKVLYSI